MRRRHALPISIFVLSLVGVSVAQNFGPTRSAGQDQAIDKSAKVIIPMRLKGQTLATDLIGATAYTRSGGEFGRVKDLLFDRAGRLAGIVVSVGGFFGVGAKEIGVPYDLVEVVKGDDGATAGVRIGLSRKQVDRAPEFKTVSEPEAAAGTALPDPELATSETRRM